MKRIPVILSALLALVLIVLGIHMWINAGRLDDRYRNYRPVNARLISCEPYHTTNADHRPVTKYRCKWSYTVGGETIVTRTITRSRKPGSSTTLYYNPANPSAYTLDQHPSAALRPLALMCLGGAFLSGRWCVRVLRRREDDSPAEQPSSGIYP